MEWAELLKRRNLVPPPDDDVDGIGNDKQSNRLDGGKEEKGDQARETTQKGRLPLELPPEVIESLPEDVREVVLRAASFSGPLPPSPMFREYEDVLPGAGDRILSMAERQAAHRQEWEKSALRSAQRESTRGQWLGFLISIAALGTATYLAMNGHLVIPLLLGSAGLSGLIANFINALRQRPSADDD